MPRKRQTATAYPNRSDLAVPAPAGVQPTPSQSAPPNPLGGPGAGTQPVRVAPGMPYGQRQQLEAAQRAVPLPEQAPGAPMAYEGSAVQQAALGMQMPNITGLGAPDDRPDLPVTAGAPMGPGAVTMAGTAQRLVPSVADTLDQLAAAEPSLVQFANLARLQGV